MMCMVAWENSSHVQIVKIYEVLKYTGRFIRNTILTLCRTPGLLSRLPQFSGWSPQGFSKETFL